MPAFLHYFNVANLTSDEQLLERINEYFVYYDDVIYDTCGFNIEDAIDFHRYMYELLNQKYNTLYKLYQKLKKIQENVIVKIPKKKFTIPKVRKELKKTTFEKTYIEYINCIERLFKIQLSELPSIKNMEKILRRYMLIRSKKNFRYYTECNPAEEQPIYKLNKEEIFIGFPRQYIVALYNDFYTIIKQSNKSKKFLKKRDEFLEEKAYELFNKYLDGHIYLNLSENINGNYEHDIIMIINKTLFVIECKASEQKEPFRDPEKAANRIRRHFTSKSGIQTGYNQGYNLIKRIMNKDVHKLYKDGKLILDLNDFEITDKKVIVVTLDNFGSIAVNLSKILEKEEKAQYPFCINLSDLENLLLSLNYFQLLPGGFINYVTERILLHEKFIADDELEILGLYISEGNFKRIRESSYDRIAFTTDMSDIIDKAIYNTKGVEYKREAKTIRLDKIKFNV